MIRTYDYHCKEHGFFENAEYLEASEALATPSPQSVSCPTCGAPSPKVWVRAPSLGKIAKGTFVVDLPGGHVLTRDDVEERISRKEGVPFADDPGFAERIYERALPRAQAYRNGEIPPKPDPTPQQREQVESALAKAGMTE